MYSAIGFKSENLGIHATLIREKAALSVGNETREILTKQYHAAFLSSMEKRTEKYKKALHYELEPVKTTTPLQVNLGAGVKVELVNVGQIPDLSKDQEDSPIYKTIASESAKTQQLLMEERVKNAALIAVVEETKRTRDCVLPLSSTKSKTAQYEKKAERLETELLALRARFNAKRQDNRVVLPILQTNPEVDVLQQQLTEIKRQLVEVTCDYETRLNRLNGGESSLLLEEKLIAQVGLN